MRQCSAGRAAAQPVGSRGNDAARPAIGRRAAFPMIRDPRRHRHRHMRVPVRPAPSRSGAAGSAAAALFQIAGSGIIAAPIPGSAQARSAGSHWPSAAAARSAGARAAGSRTPAGDRRQCDPHSRIPPPHLQHPRQQGAVGRRLGKTDAHRAAKALCRRQVDLGPDERAGRKASVTAAMDRHATARAAGPGAGLRKEMSLRRSLRQPQLLSPGSPVNLVERPVAAVLLGNRGAGASADAGRDGAGCHLAQGGRRWTSLSTAPARAHGPVSGHRGTHDREHDRAHPVHRRMHGRACPRR